MPKPSRNIAIIDQNPTASYLLERNLSKSFNVRIFESLRDFNNQMDTWFDAAVGDFDTLVEQEGSLLSTILDKPQLKWAVVTDRRPAVFLPRLEKWEIYCAIPKNTPLSVEQIVPIENLVQPMDGFGLMRYFNFSFQMFRDSVSDREEKNFTVERIINHFETCGFETHKLYDVRLVLEEMINNAFYHAFLDGNGNEKYDSMTFHRLGDGEEITLEYGSDGKFAGFSVCDNQGRLKPRQVLTKLSRQVMQEGIFDDSGRGIYLSRLLTSQLIFNIHLANRTQVICLFYERAANSLKPLCINYHDASAPSPFPMYTTEPADSNPGPV